MSVYANTREISGKATPNKTIAAFPDVCLSPPSPPAGPIPIPYPLTGVASDTTDGTSSVFIKGKEAGKKNGVKYSKVNGNQPATNSFGANVISHKITGPLKFAAYSFDVMIEKGGAERFLDMTTQNHMNQGGGSAGFSTAGMRPTEPPPGVDCEAMSTEIEDDRIAAVNDDPEAGQETASATVATASVQGTGQMYGCSSQVVAERLQSVTGKPYTTPTPTQQGRQYRGTQPTGSTICNFDPFIVHERGRDSRHAEMNILEKIDWAANPPATITFAISYPAYSSNQWDTDLPCPTCEETLRQVCACVEQIFVCQAGSNEPQPICE